MAEALHRAHEYGIVHRDIKPSNLLLDSSHKLWLADFGLARFQTDRPLTRTGEMIGTMRYMSPEQAVGRSELIDHRTDIYSLGANTIRGNHLRTGCCGNRGARAAARYRTRFADPIAEAVPGCADGCADFGRKGDGQTP